MTDRVDRRKIIPPAVLFSAVLFGCLSTLMRMVETYVGPGGGGRLDTGRDRQLSHQSLV